MFKTFVSLLSGYASYILRHLVFVSVAGRKVSSDQTMDAQLL